MSVFDQAFRWACFYIAVLLKKWKRFSNWSKYHSPIKFCLNLCVHSFYAQWWTTGGWTIVYTQYIGNSTHFNATFDSFSGSDHGRLIIRFCAPPWSGYTKICVYLPQIQQIDVWSSFLLFSLPNILFHSYYSPD